MHRSVCVTQPHSHMATNRDGDEQDHNNGQQVNERNERLLPGDFASLNSAPSCTMPTSCSQRPSRI